MRRVVRLTLIAALALLAAGTQIAPHERVAGWTHDGLDHPPTAVHATLLEHLRYLMQQDEHRQASAEANGFAPAPLVAAAATIVLAIFAFGTPRPWRPNRLGISRIADLIGARQFSTEPAPTPPRASLSFLAS